MAEVNTITKSKSRKSFSNIKTNRSTRVDLTPMVDLGFLLITFFVFTTSMTTHKTMDLIETHDGDPKQIKNSSAMTIILSKNHELYYYYGSLKANNNSEGIKKSNFMEIRNLIVGMKNKTDSNYLMFLIKPAPESTFGDTIDLLDEMSICDISAGHYAEVDITKEELHLIEQK